MVFRPAKRKRFRPIRFGEFPQRFPATLPAIRFNDFGKRSNFGGFRACVALPCRHVFAVFFVCCPGWSHYLNSIFIMRFNVRATLPPVELTVNNAYLTPGSVCDVDTVNWTAFPTATVVAFPLAS